MMLLEAYNSTLLTICRYLFYKMLIIMKTWFIELYIVYIAPYLWLP